MIFVLTGVAHEHNARRFTFELAGRGVARVKIVVVADMGLVRKYEIPLQELPLLCLRLLEGRTAGAEDDDTVIFAEHDMIEYANRRAEAKTAIERSRLAHRTPKSNLSGQAWRGSGKTEHKKVEHK
jgi:hypothetical protein